MATSMDIKHGSRDLSLKERGAAYLQSRVDILKIERKDVLREVSGALGDLGTYVPIVVALTLYNHLDLGTTLIFNGAFNIITGLVFGVPMPVQPMKSIAAAALSPTDPLTVDQIMTAGLTVSFILVFLGLSGLMNFVNWLIPLSVVRGIQLAQGLHFGLTAVTYILRTQDFSKAPPTGPNRPWTGWDSRILAIFAFCFVILVSGVGGEFGNKAGPSPRSCAAVGDEYAAAREQQEDVENSGEERPPRSLRGKAVKKWEELDACFFNNLEDAGVNPHGSADAGAGGDKSKLSLAMLPSCLIIFLLGIVLAFARYPSVAGSLTVGPSTPKITHPSHHDWTVGFVRGAIPQLPLSVLNSVIAVVKLSQDLFPDNKDVTVLNVATSVGMMNIVGCWFGAMPTCHGCGGLAGQYRFGARTGLSVVMLGLGKMLLGFLLGSSFIKLLHRFPVALLGVLLLYAGLELAMVARDMNTRTEMFIVLLITSVSLQWNNTAYGFLCGLAAAWLFKLRTLNIQALLHPSSRHTAAPPPPPTGTPPH